MHGGGPPCSKIPAALYPQTLTPRSLSELDVLRTVELHLQTIVTVKVCEPPTSTDIISAKIAIIALWTE